jgi:MFS transporter, CP family, cyanate transporter
VLASNGQGPVAVILVAGVLVGVHVGVLPPLIPQIQAQFGLSLVAAGWLLSMFQVFTILLGFAAGTVVESFGRVRLLLLGAVLMAVADIVCAFASQAAWLFIGRAISSAAQICMVVSGPALLMRLVAPERQRAVLGVYAAYMPVGMGIGLLLAPWLLLAAGLKGVWLVCGALSLLVGVSIWRVLTSLWQEPILSWSLAPALTLVKQVVAHRKPLLLAATFGCYAGQWMSVMAWLPSFYSAQGIALATTGWLTAIAVLVNAIGNVSAGLLLERGVSRSHLVAFAAIVMGLSAGVFYAWEGSFALRYLALLAFSICGGLIPGTMFASSGAYSPSPGHVPTTTGLIQQGSSTGQFLSAPALAWIVSTTGSWSYAGAFSASLAGMLLVLAWLIHRQDR